MEIIEKIEHFEDSRHNGWTRIAGYTVTTDKQVVRLWIDNSSSCCENWGYFLTEDDTDKFIGSVLRGVKLTDTNRSTKLFGSGWNDDPNYISLDAGDVMFVDIETSVGTLQFVAYNSHNGYYGHSATVESYQLNHAVTL